MAQSNALHRAWHEAQTRVERGDLAAARDVLQAGLRHNVISDDPDVLDTRRRLAEVHYGLGRLTDARRELEEALAAGEAHLGDAHPLMLAIRARLGAVAVEIGNRYAATRNFTVVRRLGPDVLGPHHPAVRVAEAYLTGRMPGSPPVDMSESSPADRHPAVPIDVPAGVRADVPAGVRADVPAGVRADVPAGVRADIPAGSPVDDRWRPGFAPPGSAWGTAPAESARAHPADASAAQASAAQASTAQASSAAAARMAAGSAHPAASAHPATSAHSAPSGHGHPEATPEPTHPPANGPWATPIAAPVGPRAAATSASPPASPPTASPPSTSPPSTRPPVSRPVGPPGARPVSRPVVPPVSVPVAGTRTAPVSATAATQAAAPASRQGPPSRTTRGTTPDRPTDATQTGKTQTGTTKTGRTQTGATQTGRTQTGTTQTGKAQTDATQTGTTQTGKAQTGRTQTGKAQTGRTQTATTPTGTTPTGTTPTGITPARTTHTGAAATGGPPSTSLGRPGRDPRSDGVRPPTAARMGLRAAARSVPAPPARTARGTDFDERARAGTSFPDAPPYGAPPYGAPPHDAASYDDAASYGATSYDAATYDAGTYDAPAHGADEMPWAGSATPDPWMAPEPEAGPEAGPETGGPFADLDPEPISRPMSLRIRRPASRSIAARWRAATARTRGKVVAGVAVALLLAAVAIAGVTRLSDKPHVVPAPAPRAPTAVTIRADGGAVTVSWHDPTSGTAPFIVAGGVAGQSARLRQQVPAGQTTVTIHGLNTKVDYCFTVVAVYGTDTVAVSDLVCTDRIHQGG